LHCDYLSNDFVSFLVYFLLFGAEKGFSRVSTHKLHVPFSCPSIITPEIPRLSPSSWHFLLSIFIYMFLYDFLFKSLWRAIARLIIPFFFLTERITSISLLRSAPLNLFSNFRCLFNIISFLYLGFAV